MPWCSIKAVGANTYDACGACWCWGVFETTYRAYLRWRGVILMVVIDALLGFGLVERFDDTGWSAGLNRRWCFRQMDGGPVLAIFENDGDRYGYRHHGEQGRTPVQTLRVGPHRTHFYFHVHQSPGSRREMCQHAKDCGKLKHNGCSQAA